MTGGVFTSKMSLWASSRTTCWRFWIFVFAILVLVKAEDDFEDSSSVILEHSFDQGPDPVFTKRGTISIQSFKLGAAQYSSEGTLKSADLAKLKKAVAEDGFYKIRVASRSGGSTLYISTYIKACLLYESSLTDFITINVDLAGNLLGLTLQTDLPYCQNVEIDEEDVVSFDTHVHVVQTGSGPVPETQLYIQKMEQEKAEKAKGQQADNRTFFGKYWMYIVPLVIFMMFASNADPNAGGGGGGGGR